MSHRCKNCDYSPSGDSIYFNGIYDEQLNRNYLIYNKATDDYTCAHCRDASSNLYDTSKTFKKS